MLYLLLCCSEAFIKCSRRLILKMPILIKCNGWLILKILIFLNPTLRYFFMDIYVNHSVIYRLVTLFKEKRWNIICDWYYIALDTTQRNVRVAFYTIRHSTRLLLLFDPSAPTGPCFLLSHLGSIYACFLAAGIVILQSSSPRSAYIATFLAPGSILSLNLLLPNKAGKDTRLVRLSDCMRSLLRR